MPIFLVWIYLGWVIVLLGAVIAAYAPQPADAPGALARRARARTSTSRSPCCASSPRRATTGARGLDGRRDRRSELRIDPLQVDPVLDALVALDWVGRLDEPKATRATCCCAIRRRRRPSRCSRKLLLDPAPDLEATWQRAGFDTVRLGELLRAPARWRRRPLAH